MWRCAVRHLYARNDSCGGASAGEKTGARAGRHPRGTCGKSLPLHGIHADFRSGGPGRATQNGKMRADPADYKLVSPGNLQAVFFLLVAVAGPLLSLTAGRGVVVFYFAGKTS